MTIVFNVFLVLFLAFLSPAIAYYSVVGVGLFFKWRVARHWSRHRKQLRVLLRENRVWRGSHGLKATWKDQEDVTYEVIRYGKKPETITHNSIPAHWYVEDETLKSEAERSEAIADKFGLTRRWYRFPIPNYHLKYSAGWVWFKPSYRSEYLSGPKPNRWYYFLKWLEGGGVYITPADGWYYSSRSHWNNKPPKTAGQIWQHFFFKLLVGAGQMVFNIWQKIYDFTYFLQIWLERKDYAEELFATIADRRRYQYKRILEARAWVDTKFRNRRVHDGYLDENIDLPYDDTWMKVEEVEHRNPHYADDHTWEYNLAWHLFREDLESTFGPEKEGGFWATGGYDTYYRVFTDHRRFVVSPVFQWFEDIEGNEHSYFDSVREWNDWYIFEEAQEIQNLQWDTDYLDEDKLEDHSRLSQSVSYATLYHTPDIDIWNGKFKTQEELAAAAKEGHGYYIPLLFEDDFDFTLPIWAYFLARQLYAIENYPNEHVQGFSDWQVIEGLYMLDLLDEEKLVTAWHKEKQEVAKWEAENPQKPSWTRPRRTIDDTWHHDLENLKRRVYEERNNQWSRFSAFWDDLLGFSPFMSEVERRNREARKRMRPLPGFEELMGYGKN